MTAIISGAVASAKPTTEKLIRDLYDGLKVKISYYCANSLDAFEKKPDSKAKQASLLEDLKEVKAAEEKDLLLQAYSLLKTISDQPPQILEAIGVNIENVKAGNASLQGVIVSGDQALGVMIKNSEFKDNIEITNIRVVAKKKEMP